MPEIESFHAHVYFDETEREPARRLREAVEARFDVEMGRWHEKPVGPHPRWSYQIAFKPSEFDKIVPWLMLNRAGLQIFLHPNTGDDLADHTAHVSWLGPSIELNTAMFEKKKAAS
jgi:DOPA 4,5-dioxygenase